MYSSLSFPKAFLSHLLLLPTSSFVGLDEMSKLARSLVCMIVSRFLQPPFSTEATQMERNLDCQRTHFAQCRKIHRASSMHPLAGQ
jgi:hypothetical protein